MTHLVRIPLRDLLTRNKATLDFYAQAAGVEPKFTAIIKPKRVQKPRDPHAITEAMTLRAILKYLRHHPKVAFARRQQSGLLQAGENRLMRIGHVGALDIGGMLKAPAKQPGRRLEVEVKRPGGKLTKEQAEEIAFINSHGGLAFMADSIETCERELANA
jgi:hypothetical protein